MKLLLIIVMLSGSLIDIIKISLMSRKNLILWCILWGVIGGISTIWVSEMTRNLFWGNFNMKNYIVLQWIELAIFSLYLFKYNYLRIRQVLKFYPGFIIGFSIFVITYYILTYFPGYDFKTMAFINGVGIFLVLMATTLFFKSLRINDKTLYMACLFCGVLNIISLGIS